MKILIASDTYIYQTSGAANMVEELARGLRRRGHEVRVLAPADGRRSFQQGDDVFLSSYPAFYYPDLRISMAYRDPLLRQLADWSPDLIHAHTEGSMYRMACRIAEKTGAPLIMTAHTNYEHFVFGPLRGTGPVGRIMRIYGKRIYRNAAAVISPSEKGRSLSQLEPARDRLHVIPNGIRPGRMRDGVGWENTERLLRYWELQDSGCIAIVLTRLSREKNIEELLRFFPGLLKEIPRARLLIVGDGPDRRRLESICRKLNLSGQVRFTGRVEPDEVQHYYAMGKVFLSASTFEMHSIACLEAMASGLPLVCRRDSWLKGVLEEGANGYSYTSEQEFIGSMKKIFKDPALHRRMKEESLRRAERFSMDHCLDQTLRLYEQVSGGGGREKERDEG